MLTQDAIDIIKLAGVTPPPRDSHRTTCPECSDFRRKRGERCVVVKEYEWGVEWKCHHCGHIDGRTW